MECNEHLPWHDIQWVLNCVGYTVMLQDDNGAISGLTWTLLLEFGSHYLKHSTATVCTDCVDITWFDVWNCGHYTCKNTLYIILTWISMVRAKFSASTTCTPTFLWVVDYATSHQRPQYATEIHHPSSGTTARVPVIFTCHTPLVCQSMWDPVGTCLLIYRVPYNYIKYYYTHI